MKRLTLFSLLSLFASSTLLAQELTFTETSHDFGAINEADGEVHYDFHFTNTGDAPLVIKQVITGCGCTSAKWSEKPYAPGDKGVIRVSYHPEGRKIEKFSQVTEVFTNLPNPATLTISGSVTLVKHPYVNYFDPAKGERKTPKTFTPKDDYELVLMRIRQNLYESTPVETMDKNATSLMKLMTPEGIWPQIDYKCFFRTNWEPADHLSRIKRMAMAYTCPESSLYGNQVLFRAIDKAVRAWNEYKPTSYNWWYNQISVPKIMADILALMEVGESKLSDGAVQCFMEMMEQSDPRKWTGANKMDIAIHHLIRGCVLKNDSIVSTNVKEFFEPVCITDGEGIREDMSYQQHGTQLYIGGYGSVFVDNIAKTAGLFTGTRFALSDEQIKLFSEFVRNTYLNVFRSHYMDFSVCGRSVSRAKTLDPGNYAFLFKKMKEIDSLHADEYDMAAQRFSQNNSVIGRTNKNQMFYLSDYMLHNRKRFDFSVRAVSARTRRSESGNGENLLGTYLSEGATNIRVTGDEYYNIFPVWEWDKIPGTTTPAGEVENHNDWGVAGTAQFVGGVSDGLYGVMAYGMDDYGMKANKGWFMFDNEIVCLGSGITSQLDKEINTSVNQCHLVGDVYATTAGKMGKMISNSRLDSEFSGWVWHNKIGYFFPDSISMHLKNEQQQGKWSKINFNQSDQLVSMPVFNLYVSHGKKPQEDKYAYYIVPGIASPASLATYNPADVPIICNEPSLQAVYNQRLDILQIIFWEAGTLRHSQIKVEADIPCVVMVKGCTTDKPEIVLTDPTQKNNLTVGKEVRVVNAGSASKNN